MVDLPSLLPANSTKFERSMEQVLGARLIRFEVAADMVATLWDPHRCPAEYLPWLAWSVAVPYWRTAWPEQFKRALIADAPAIHAQRGFVPGIERGLSAIGLQMDITLWHQMDPEGQPGTFQGVLWANDNRALTPEAIDDGLAMVKATKRQSQHADIRLGAKIGAGLRMAALAAAGQSLAAKATCPQGMPARIGTAVGADGTNLCTARATAPMGLRLGTLTATGADACRLFEARMTVQ
ncbi:MAG: phage tail protein I [Rhodospirillaceae bacterium]|nr:phage tail protein I [Rhodospirillales bacterium]